MSKIFRFFLRNRQIIAILLLLTSQPAFAQDEAAHVQIRLIPEKTTLTAGQSVWVGIEETIDPEWHTYFFNPGDSGAEARISWTMPDGMTADPIVWPAPSRIPYAGLVNYGFEGQATLLQKLTAPAALPDGPITLTAKIEILVCKDICIPEVKTQTITFNDPATAPADNSAAIAAITAAMPQTMGWTGTYREENGDFVIALTGQDAGSFTMIDANSIAVFPIEWGLIKNAETTRPDTTIDGRLILKHQRDERDLSEVKDVATIITYRTTDNVAHAVAITLTKDEKAGIVAPVAAPEQDVEDEKPSITMMQAIFFALLGGLILNLMPCVFPVLSLKALKLIDLQNKGHGLAAIHGVAYTIGVLLSFALIGGALLTVKAAGGDSGWGFQLQNPQITLFLAYLLFLIGLSLSGLFEIGGSLMGAGSSLAAKGGIAGSFFTGVLATLVATPCTAPFMAGALGFALVQPAPVAMIVFLALGLGLALPYLTLSLVPPLARLLPKPGMWMLSFKEFLAFPMYISAAWMVWVLDMQAGSSGVMWGLTGMVAMAFAIWIIKHRPANKIARAIVLAIALCGFAFAAIPYMKPGILHMEDADGQAITTEKFTQGRLNELLNGDHPVFAYMTAAWCITCKVNEHIAIDTPATMKLLNETGTSVIAGDWTNMNPEITKFLKHYGRSGVPLYVFYGPRDSGTGERPLPVILPQILTEGIVADTLNQKNQPQRIDHD